MLIHLYMEVGVEPTRRFTPQFRFWRHGEAGRQTSASRLATPPLNGFVTSPTVGCFARTGVNTPWTMFPWTRQQVGQRRLPKRLSGCFGATHTAFSARKRAVKSIQPIANRPSETRAACRYSASLFPASGFASTSTGRTKGSRGMLPDRRIADG